MAKNSKRSWKLQEFQSHIGAVNCLAIGHKSGKVMVTGGEDRKVNLWAVGKMSCILSLKGHTTSIESVRFNSSEDVVAAGSQSGALKIWNLEASKIIRTLSGHKSSIRCLDFHPFGDIIASGSMDTNIKLWDFRKKGCIFTYKGHSNCVNSLQFSPDGKWIVSASDDNTAKLWDMMTGKVISEFKQHTSPVTSVKFHPIDFLLTTGSADKTVKFWDLETFQLVSSTDGGCGPIRTISMHPEGSCAYAACQDYLMVYGWEPAVTYDSVNIGWGRPADVVVHQNELIGASFQQSNVSIFIADLLKIQPIGLPQDTQTITTTTTTDPSSSPFTQNPTRRRSFITKNCQTAQTKTIIGDNDQGRSHESTSNSNPSSHQSLDYDQVFNPKKELSREIPATCPDNKPFNGNRGPSPFTTSEPKQPSPAAPSHPLKNSDDLNQRHPLKPSEDQRHPLKPPEDQRHPISETPFVRPSKRPPVCQLSSKTNSVQMKQLLSNKDAEQQGDLSILPFGKERKPDVDIEDFLPKPHHLSYKMDEDKAISIIRAGHQVQMSVLSTRNKNIQVFKTLWTGGNIKVALDAAVAMNDQAILQDVIFLLLQRPQSWSLETCSCVLPVISKLILSRYETQVNTGLNAVKFILRSFALLIRESISNVSSIGVDITREERYNKSVHCHKLLMGTRDEINRMFQADTQNLNVKEIRLLLSQLE